MNLEDIKKLCKYKENKIKKLMANHNHCLSVNGAGIVYTKINHNCDSITKVAECYKNKKLSDFIK